MQFVSVLPRSCVHVCLFSWLCFLFRSILFLYAPNTNTRTHACTRTSLMDEGAVVCCSILLFLSCSELLTFSCFVPVRSLCCNIPFVLIFIVVPATPPPPSLAQMFSAGPEREAERNLFPCLSATLSVRLSVRERKRIPPSVHPLANLFGSSVRLPCMLLWRETPACTRRVA